MSQVDFDAALAAGREKGQLTPDELIEVLHNVELTPEVLGHPAGPHQRRGCGAGRRRCRRCWPSGDRTSACNRAPRPSPNAASRTAGSGARRTGSDRRAAESSGSAEDPVHTYLKEIGRVPLLNAALEVEIAQAIEVGQRGRRLHCRARVGASVEKGRSTTC